MASDGMVTYPVLGCNTLNLGYKISSLISTKFRCYLFLSLQISLLFLFIEFCLFIGEVLLL
jgi:hypothetical protein